MYGYRIRCELYPFSCAIIHYLINKEKIDKDFWNMQDVLKTFMLESLPCPVTSTGVSSLMRMGGPMHAIIKGKTFSKADI
jgi:hypothetical protein